MFDRRLWIVGSLTGLALVAAHAQGRKPTVQDIKPAQRGSAANPNSAYNPPAWSYQPPANVDKTASAHPKSATTTNKQKPTPDSPAPSNDAFPDYVEPQQPAKPAPPLAKDSLEPPLPDEPGALDKQKSFK